MLNDAIRDGVARGLGLGQSVADVSRSPQPPFARLSLLCAAARLDDSRHRARRRSAPTSSTCTRPRRAKRSARRSLRDFRYFTSFVSQARGRRLSQLRIGRDAARSVSEGRVARAQPRPLARRPDDGQLRLHAHVPRRKPTSSAARSPASAAAIRSPATTSSCCRSWPRAVRRWLRLAAAACGREASTARDRPTSTSGFDFQLDYDHVFAGVAQWLEHAAHIRSVRGSSPCTGTNF